MSAPNSNDTKFFDLRDSRSVINLLPPLVREMAIQHVRTDWLKLDDEQLRMRVEPTPLMEQLRISFWDEYERVQDHHKRAMSITKIYSKCCSKEFFYEVFIKDVKCMTWLFSMPQNLHLAMKEILDFGLYQMREIMRMPNMEAGKANTRLIAEKVKIFALLDNRVQGAVRQTLDINQKSMNLNMNVERQLADSRKSLPELEKEIKSLTSQIKKVEAGATTLRVDGKVEDPLEAEYEEIGMETILGEGSVVREDEGS